MKLVSFFALVFRKKTCSAVTRSLPYIYIEFELLALCGSLFLERKSANTGRPP